MILIRNELIFDEYLFYLIINLLQIVAYELVLFCGLRYYGI